MTVTVPCTNNPLPYSNPKRVAVCLYGQVRIGTYLLPWIKHVYDLSSQGVEVDFFVSIKDINSYINDPTYKVGSSQHINTADIINKIKDTLNIDHVNVITNEQDKIASHSYAPHCTAIFDVILQKQKQEMINHFNYDFVFMQRFDSMFLPINYPLQVIKWLRHLDIHSYKKSTDSFNFNFILAENCIYENVFLSKICYVIQDLMMSGTSFAWDIVATKLAFNFSTTTKELKYTEEYSKAIPRQMDPHMTLTDAIHKAGVDIHPLIRPYTFESPWYIGKDNSEHITYTVIRDSFDLTLDPFDVATFIKFQKEWSNYVINKGK